jgi:glucosamine-6-phosphate deaminase
MRLAWCDNPDTFNDLAADQVSRALTRKPNAAIALPTGQTPLGLYAQLRSRARSNLLSFARAHIFNLDEYVGLSAADPMSYAHYLHVNLIDAVKAPPGNVCLLRGEAPDLDAECRAYDAAVTAAGGLDLAILGLGSNGHIAFNEPSTSWDATTHIVELSAETRNAHRQQLDASRPIPTHGLTLGIANIRQAREVLLLVSGPAKQQALAALRQGLPDPGWPVTSLLDHPYLTVVAEARLKA